MVLIRDAVHGSIELNALEGRVLDSSVVQRLRGLRQLATASLVFPSAVHTRFEHSLGTFYLASRLCPRFGFSKERAQLLRLCALLHDVGHGAFSHLSEPFLKRYLKKSHEELAVARVRQCDVGELVEKEGLPLKALEALLLSKSRDSAIISGDLGTDRMDYLLRDALFCGVSYSVVDAQRLLETLEFGKGGLVVGEKGRVPAESLLVSRYLMFNSVYFHHAVRISYAMLRKAIDDSLEDGKISISDVADGTDYSLMHLLLQNCNPLASGVAGRKLFKRAFSLRVGGGSNERLRKFFGSKGAEKELNVEFSRACGSFDDFVLCLPEVHSKPLGVKISIGGKKTDLSGISPLARALEAENAEREFIVACRAEKRAAVEKAAKKFFAGI